MEESDSGCRHDVFADNTDIYPAGSGNESRLCRDCFRHALHLRTPDGACKKSAHCVSCHVSGNLVLRSSQLSEDENSGSFQSKC